MSNSKASIGGIFTFQHLRNGEVIDKWDEHNIVVDEGLRYILDSSLNSTGSGVSPITNYYIGLFKNNYNPLNTDTFVGSTNFIDATKAGEVITSTDVSNTTRPIWTLPTAALTTNTLSNSASPVDYTFTSATAVVVYGAFLTTQSQINVANAGDKLISASKFTASRSMQQNDVLRVTYEISASSV